MSAKTRATLGLLYRRTIMVEFVLFYLKRFQRYRVLKMYTFLATLYINNTNQSVMCN